MESGSDIRELQLEPMITDKRREQLAIVSGSMARARLQAVMGLFAPLMGSRRLTFPPGTPGHVPDSLNKLINGRLTPTLQQTREVFAALFASPDNVRHAYLALPAAYAQTLDDALDHIYVSTNAMKRLIKDNMAKYMEPRLSGEPIEKFVNLDSLSAIFLRVASQNWSGEDIYSLEPPLLELLSSDLDTGLWRYDQVVKVAEVPSDLTVYDVSARVGASLGTIQSVAMGPDMQYVSASRIMRPSSLKIAAAMFAMPELFSDISNRPMRQACLRSLFTLMPDCVSQRARCKDIPPVEQLRTAFTRCEFQAYTLVLLALPYVKGLNKQLFNTVSGYDILRVVIMLLKVHSADPERPWISVDDLVRRIFTASYVTSRYLINFGAARPIADPVTVDEEGNVLTYTTLLRDFTLPGYRGMLAVLAAMGLVALARDKAVADPARPYDSLQYVRLTGLGRYVVGIDREYKADDEVPATEYPCTLDQDYLLVSASNDDAARVVKSYIGRQVSGTLFRVDAESFMRNVESERGLDARIELLRHLTGVGVLPPVWQTFIAGLRLRFSAVTPHFPGEYVVLDINPECRELVRYITEDSRVRRLVRLVEGNSILVGKDKYGEFHLLMEKAGYHIPEIMWPLRYY